ncbi:MAG: NAD-dependent epimerase/dehydratase family protein [Pseudomonadota bacterium]
MKTALVTGSAGFIGFHVSTALLRAGWRVIGLDSLSPYYDVSLKHARHDFLNQNTHFTPLIGKIEEPGLLTGVFHSEAPEVVVHLAAQAGVRHSIEAPRTYLETNVSGTFELFDAARAQKPAHLLVASSSSVYGANSAMPYTETERTDFPMSLYAATKKTTEGIGHTYAHLYGLPTTLFRFFTVYGPWGRPDMAYFKFTRAILNGDPIDVYNHGDMLRDFTYVDDLVAAIVALVDVPPGDTPVSEKDSLSPVAPWRVVNIGNNTPEKLGEFIEAIEQALGKTAQKNFLPMQPGDVPATWADTDLLRDLIGFRPTTSMKDGVKAFVDWYLGYYYNT